MNRVVTLIALTIATAGVLHAQQGPVDDWATLTARLDRAAVNGLAVGLKDVRADLLRMIAQPPSEEREPLVQYAIAYTAWRMAFMSAIAGRERDEMLDDAVTRLQTILKASPRDAEAHALLGAVYTAQIGRSPLRGMVLGGRVSGTLDRAAELAPENPRVALQQGISAFHTPAVFGGGVEKAERWLRRSLDAFARERTDRRWPDWGRVDAHAWLGQVLARSGDRAAARAEYDKALALAPDSGWVRNVLLPALERGAKP